MLHTNTVEGGTLELLKSISAHPGFSNFYLAGGTALALQIGHRKSMDLDFFSILSFDENQIVGILESDFNASIINQYQNTVLCSINGVKVDVISHQYEHLHENTIIGGVCLASIEDIAAMKLNAIVGRGSKKDFVDIFFLLAEYSLNQLILFHKRKYPNQNDLLVLKSLTYFADADLDPELIMIEKCHWDEVKQSVVEKVNNYIKGI